MILKTFLFNKEWSIITLTNHEPATTDFRNDRLHSRTSLVCFALRSPPGSLLYHLHHRGFFKELTDVEARSRLRWVTIFHSLFFITGFSLVFILMGASATYLGQLLAQYQYWIMKGGGVLIILLGIHFTGIINIPFLQIEKRFEMRKKPLGYIGSLFVEWPLQQDGPLASDRSSPRSLSMPAHRKVLRPESCC